MARSISGSGTDRTSIRMTLHAIPTARAVSNDNIPVPLGFKLRARPTHLDERGGLTELFREEWELGPKAHQWNMVRSHANVLRGVHAHRDHVDYLAMTSGEMVLGLHDLRPDSPTHRLSVTLRLQSDDIHLAVIPVGVAHGFYFPELSCLVYGVTSGFDGTDEFGCHWADAALGLEWPCESPLLSERDRTAGSYAGMISAIGL